MAKFLQVKELTDPEMNRLVSYISFDNMKKVKSLDYFQTLYDPGIFDRDTAVFYRKGKIGNWREHFTSELSQKFDTVIQDKLKYKGEIDYGQ